MAAYSLPEMSPWKRHPLTIPPNSLRAWLRLAAWEFWMGVLVYGALHFGTALIARAPASIGTGPLNVVFNSWCGLMLIGVAAWLIWELWSAVAPKPITDDFLTLLDNSFGRDWRKPLTWPWARALWAYAFPLLGAMSAFLIWTLVSS